MQYIWTIPLILASVHGAYLSTLNNKGSDSGWFYIWFITVQLMNTILWVYVSKYSDSLVFDTVLFDSLMISSYILAVCYFNKSGLDSLNYVGVALCIIGLI